MRSLNSRHLTTVIVLAAVLPSSPAYAQLDPLLFLKNTQPNVIIAVDTAQRMWRDTDTTTCPAATGAPTGGCYMDPGTYAKSGALHEAVLGLLSGESATNYRRRYINLVHTENSGAPEEDRFNATRIESVGDLEASYSTFYERSKLYIARRGLIKAITDNLTTARFALVRTRQTGATMPAAGNEDPVRVSDVNQQAPTDTNQTGRWKITRVRPTTSNSATTASGLLTAADAANASSTVLATLQKNHTEAGALLPAGQDARNVVDAPISLLMDDVRTHATSLITADAAAGGCRNTIVVMVVGGGEGTITNQNLTTKASTFLNVSGRRVPIYVVAIAPSATEATTYQAVATNSGGQYFEITPAMVNAVAAGEPVFDIARAVTLAVQHAIQPSTDFNTAPTASLPIGPLTEHQVTSPIIGTVNLHRANRFNPTSGAVEQLPDSETLILHTATGVEVPQRSNVLVTSGFSLPGFDGKLRALRVYRPVPDTTRPTGFRFTQDGSRLWVARTPTAAEGPRNIYTVLPNSDTLVKFHTDNVASIDDYLGVTDPSTLIDWVRSQPIGAVIGSTPAFLDPPSLDPPPDVDYPNFREANKDRRALIFVGANDGMIHAIDARTGVEVWAFVPFNLLPKLRALRYGQPVGDFKYFVDNSPKISDVRVGGVWRTFLFFGQGAGGTFYNALDVTLANISNTVTETQTSNSVVVNYFSDVSRITFKWSYPRRLTFDATASTFGDITLAKGATAEELSVGETWSDPAIGQVQDETGMFVMVTGSGFMKRSVELLAHRGGARAGRRFYVLDVATGTLLDSHDVGADSSGEEDDNCKTAGDCRRIKNALQMDPVATGPSDSRFITKVYIGDLDGKVWRFGLEKTGVGQVDLMTPVQLFTAGAAHPLFSSMATVNVGGTKQYIFVGTGSELLPTTGVAQSYSLIVLLDNGASATKTAEILLERTDGVDGDERVTAFPAVAGDIVFFTTTTLNNATLCTPFTANLYAFTFIGGPAYDTNNDGRLTAPTSSSAKKSGGGSGATADSTKVFSTVGVRATAPFIVDQHLVFSAGGRIEMFGDPDDFNNGVGQAGVRILSWRLVR